MMQPEWQIRSVQEGDFAEWLEAYRGYREFYELDTTVDMMKQIWGWLCDPAHVMEGHVLVADGRVVTIAHTRVFPRPHDASVGLYLDEFFTVPEARGRGYGKKVVEYLGNLAKQQGASVLRWITNEDNIDAVNLYEKISERTNFLTFDIEFESSE